VRGERILYVTQDFFPICLDFLGMEAEHRTTVVRILPADVENGMARSNINGRQEDGRTASLAGSLDDGVTVCCEFFAVEVAVGVDVIGCWHFSL
jgi:hypothetical protein